MTRRLHRLLLLATLTIAMGAGLWCHRAAAALPVEASSAGDTDVVAVTHATHDHVITVRLRTPTPPCTVAGTPSWLRTRHAAPTRLHLVDAGRRGTTKLHALLRVYRI